MKMRGGKIARRIGGLFIMIGTVLTGFIALPGWRQMAHPAFAASAAFAEVVDIATGPITTIAASDAPGNAAPQKTTAATEGGAKVSIANFTFSPAEVTIAPGETVTWINDDGAPHGLEYNDGAKGTDLLLPGASFTRQFDRPGTYDYNCSVHPYMTGRVVVRAQ